MRSYEKLPTPLCSLETLSETLRQSWEPMSVKQITRWRPRARHRQGRVCAFIQHTFIVCLPRTPLPPLAAHTDVSVDRAGWLLFTVPYFHRVTPVKEGYNWWQSLSIRDSGACQRSMMAKGTISGKWLVSESYRLPLGMEMLMWIILTTSLDYCGVYMRLEMGLLWIWQSLSIKAFTCAASFQGPSYVFTRSFLFYKLYK